MPVRIDVRQLSFGEPAMLWLLVVPALLLVLWAWRLIRRRVMSQQLRRGRTVPVRERFAPLGDLPFWLCLILSSVFLILALARPHGPATAVRSGGVDVVILQDGSASMYVQDVPGSRWRRSIQFLRILGDSLSWNSDRIAMALFAHIAAPQIRLTKDPNTFFFFVDHLDVTSPFRIEDETTWDTNLEQGIYWGLRLIERDEEMHGKSPNAKAFIMLSDGETWSGEVEKSLKKAQDAGIPLFVIGVGTLGGGRMPEFKDAEGNVVHDAEVPTTSRLDRASLQKLASAGGGQYFELDRDGDRHVANTIIDTAKRMAPSLGASEQAEELYWRFLVVAAIFPFIGMVFLRDRAELWIQTIGVTVAAAIVLYILG
ncbi:MAG TPA: VWA domain-containing protein [Vicinamibacterales bacterium]|nr:VWA domain-containing protein [Vicinamibacterales bacterium]